LKTYLGKLLDWKPFDCAAGDEALDSEASGEPQAKQNLLSDGFCAPQLPQKMVADAIDLLAPLTRTRKSLSQHALLT
jgi:hypothetical protein